MSESENSLLAEFDSEECYGNNKSVDIDGMIKEMNQYITEYNRPKNSMGDGDSSFQVLSDDNNTDDEFQIDSSDEDPSSLDMMKKQSSRASAKLF